jgi:hypothetical protein
VQRCSSIAAKVVFEQHPPNDLNARSSVYTQEVFSLSLSDANHNFDGL